MAFVAKLLADERVAGPAFRDEAAQRLLRGAVGDCDRRVVGFALGGQARLKMSQRDAPGLPGRIQGEMEQGVERWIALSLGTLIPKW